MENKLLNLKEKFDTYKKCVNFIKKYGYNSYEELCEVIYNDEVEEFISAINKGEEETLNFLKNH